MWGPLVILEYPLGSVFGMAHLQACKLIDITDASKTLHCAKAAAPHSAVHNQPHS